MTTFTQRAHLARTHAASLLLVEVAESDLDPEVRALVVNALVLISPPEQDDEHQGHTTHVDLEQLEPEQATTCSPDEPSRRSRQVAGWTLPLTDNEYSVVAAILAQVGNGGQFTGGKRDLQSLAHVAGVTLDKVIDQLVRPADDRPSILETGRGARGRHWYRLTLPTVTTREALDGEAWSTFTGTSREDADAPAQLQDVLGGTASESQ